MSKSVDSNVRPWRLSQETERSERAGAVEAAMQQSRERDMFRGSDTGDEQLTHDVDLYLVCAALTRVSVQTFEIACGTVTTDNFVPMTTEIRQRLVDDFGKNRVELAEDMVRHPASYSPDYAVDG